MKFKYILIILIFLIGLLATIKIQHNLIVKKNIENSRLLENNYQLMNDNQQITNLNLKNNEVTGKLKLERDSLAAVLKIKPKQIEKIIYINNIIRDTVNVPVYTAQTDLNEWNIMDSTKCFKWSGNAFRIGNDLKVIRTDFQYDNRTTQTFFKKRPHKCWFVHYGKWQYFQKIDSECGDIKFESFTFLKE